MITLSNKTISAIPLTNKGKENSNTWEDMEMAWDETLDEWDNQTTILENKTANTVTLADKAKL